MGLVDTVVADATTDLLLLVRPISRLWDLGVVTRITMTDQGT